MQKHDDRGRESARNFISECKTGLDFLADAIAERKYQDTFLSVVNLKDCVQYFKDETKRLEGHCSPAGFVISVKKNYDPRNENDQYIVIQGLVDKARKPIVHNGESISRIMHTRTIDSALIRALDGKETGVFML